MCLGFLFFFRETSASFAIYTVPTSFVCSSPFATFLETCLTPKWIQWIGRKVDVRSLLYDTIPLLDKRSYFTKIFFLFHLLLKKSDEKDVDTSSLCPVIARCEIVFFPFFLYWVPGREFGLVNIPAPPAHFLPAVPPGFASWPPLPYGQQTVPFFSLLK